MSKPKKPQFEHEPRHTCTGAQCQFYSHYRPEDRSGEYAENREARREARREKVRKTRRGIN